MRGGGYADSVLLDENYTYLTPAATMQALGGVVAVIRIADGNES